jgi:HAD superfamily hydrolase (TIGR01549 family)
MKQYQNYLLDWDGCLARTLEVWLKGYRETYEEFGLPQSDEEITKFSFNNQHGPLERGIEDLELFMEALIGRINEDLGKVDMYPGAKELINAIKAAGHNVALITSSPRVIIDSAIRHNGLDTAFSTIVTADEVKYHKPNPEVIHKALENMSLPHDALEHTVIVGDSKSDLGSAANAGIDSILFYPAAHAAFYDLDTLKSFSPTYIIDSFDALTNNIR